jgi:hypothetical protein
MSEFSSPRISPTATRHAFVIGCSAPVAMPASTFPPQGLSLQPLQTHSPPDARDRSPQRPHALALAEGRPHPHAPSDPGVEALVALLGAKNAIKRVETELRRARRARSRKLHAFWSGVLVRIETETDPQRNPKPPRGARRIASLAMTRGRRVKGAPGDGVGAEALETPAPCGVSRRLVPRRRRTRLLDRGVSGGLGSDVFRVILLGRQRRRHGPQYGKQAARARRSPRTHARYAKPASRPRIPCSSSPPSHEAARAVATQA